MADLDDERLIQNPILRLKAALHAACGKICDQLQIQSNITVDKQVVAAVGDVTFQQIETFCQDLDVFSKHGKRTTINADDVRLLCRRNPGLLDKIDDVQRSLKPSKPTSRSSNSRSNISSRYDDHNRYRLYTHIVNYNTISMENDEFNSYIVEISWFDTYTYEHDEKIITQVYSNMHNNKN
ncbi:unnamed protein product [Rotaria socialis]